jgi:hypothetical protein
LTTIEVETNAAAILCELQRKATVQGRSLAALLQPLAEATPAEPLDGLRKSFELRDKAKLHRQAAIALIPQTAFTAAMASISI